jgi:hypothetical protein
VSYQLVAAAAKLANFAFPFSHRWKLDAFGSRRRLLLWARASRELSYGFSPSPFIRHSKICQGVGRPQDSLRRHPNPSKRLSMPAKRSNLALLRGRAPPFQEGGSNFPFGPTATANFPEGLVPSLLLPACLYSLSFGPLITNRGSNFCRRSPSPKGTASAAG